MTAKDEEAAPVRIWKVRSGERSLLETDDEVAVEEPLEIRVEGQSVAVVMRTPGHDRELAAGFLVSEGVVRSPGEIFEISACPSAVGPADGNVIDVVLTRAGQCDLGRLTRHVFTSSSCGICGKATIDEVLQAHPPLPPSEWAVPREVILGLPQRLRAAQETFAQTGGLHASALFDVRGELEIVREDVGRHNALDKVVGEALLGGRIPLGDRMLLVSGRVSFELTQKALFAGIPLVMGISAPSSLAVACAREAGLTLIGFLRDNRCNIYSHPRRVL